MFVEQSIKKGIGIVSEAARAMPAAPGIYKMINIESEIVYVGKAKNLPKRVISYTKVENLPTRLKRMIASLSRIEYLTTNTEAEALLLEANLIKSLKPKFNIALKDDKSFPYIVIEDKHDYPRIAKFRGTKKENYTYFGPFAQARNVNETIVELQKLFGIRPCSDSYFASRKRPCLQYQIKRCTAPCTNKISKENYQKIVKQTKDFLSGKNSEIQTKLISEMERASEKLDYEKAAELRDRIRLLSQTQAKNKFKTDSISDADLIALHRDDTGCAVQVMFIRNGTNYGDKVYFPIHTEELSDGEVIELFIGQIYQRTPPAKNILTTTELPSKEALEQALNKLWDIKTKIIIAKKEAHKHLMEIALLNAKEALSRVNKQKAKQLSTLENVAKLFELPKTPKRIEVYDNSHIQGTNAVGCMIVAGAEGFMKNQYRRFLIKSLKGIGEGDDYQMLREVLERRFKRLMPDNYPDLILIDGGKGHLSVAKEMFEKFNISDIKLVCISKGADRNAGREFFHTLDKKPFQLDRNDPTLHYLQLIRDEVHRFAIESHRKRRIKDTTKSGIDEIPQIGAKRKKLLLSHFGSLERLKEANFEDIIRIGGISKKIAKLIHNYLHNEQ
ncbi:UvrABC system protein C [endosymbiont of Acanthamoeba sp. UWC8]|uniref:excinuclease ABC subunit UvrC n=1 Tax=endosymbiont of Acanthamoeba sp. UWC8 TaxID=86106 RepID=UPI0004D1CE2D|nr:excinuclease ABC subunit UvrC [endosymbiont of Acanthamoeba sp. UWC8]AIF80894.1 UvrABC system protein C [endosymbiont of Acanthamoeba sp. UWC8]